MKDDSPLIRLPRRPADGHKGTFGTVVVIGGGCGGDHRMIGAPALSALGALRAGAGLAKLAMPEPILSAGLTICPSATGRSLTVDGAGNIIAHQAAEVFDSLLAGATSLVIGPGMGKGEGVSALALRAVQQEQLSVVIDADALNALAETPELARDFRATAILTPHPGEFKRLAASLRIAGDPTDDVQRPSAAAALAQRLGCIVVLEGAGTIVSDGLRAWTCERGHPCLGTAGTGDVLSGIIAGLLAQYPALSPYELARVGVDAHARCGEAWASAHASEAGLLAEELTDLLPRILEKLRSSS